MISASGIELRAGARVLIESASFRIAKGDRIGLVGRNGAGKTTLTKVLAGEGIPVGGTVTRSGEVGYLPQDPRTGDLDILARDRVLSARGLDVLLRKMRENEQRIANGQGATREKALKQYERNETEFLTKGGYAAEAEAATIAAALNLLHSDPVVDFPGRDTWEAALERATTVIAHAAFLTDGIREHANVVFPAESYAEKEGTITHPDGRVQRLRPAIGHPGSTRSEWSVIAEVSRRLGHDLGVLTGPMVTAQVAQAVPFYAGLTLDEIGGTGVRWQAREAAAAFPEHGLETPAHAEPPAVSAQANGRLRLGTFRSIWNATEVKVSPALRFLHPKPQLEISPVDAQRLELFQGDRVIVGSDGKTVDATVTLRDATPEGSVFIETNAIDGPLVEVRKA